MLPDTAHFTDLVKTWKSCHAAALSCTLTELAEVLSRLNKPKLTSISHQYAVFLEFDDNTSSAKAHNSIKDVLDLMHLRYPALAYPHYKQQLHIHEIHNLASASQFDAAFYNSVIGMDYGAAYLFCEWVIEMSLGMQGPIKRKIGVARSMGIGGEKRVRLATDDWPMATL